MDPLVILTKCITLLYLESHLENSTENSSDLVKTAIEKIHVSDVDIGMATRRSITSCLKDLVIEMCKNPIGHQYEKEDFTQQLRLVTNGDQNIYTAIVQGLEVETQVPVLKRRITNLRKAVNNFFREQKAAELLKRASRDFSFNRQNIPDVTEYIRNLIMELEVVSSKAVAKDPGIIRTMDFSDENSMREVFNDVANSNTADLPFKTGWRELNEGLQGGPRPGDTLVAAALQHNYKTGFSLTTFAHIPIYNKPKCKDPTKKPLCYRISLEDPLRNNAQFLYQLLKYEETGESVTITDVTVDDMVAYVKQRLSVNGYYTLFDEVNPSNWTYQSLINRVVELESQGYCIEVLCVDYLSKLPTTGCQQGAIGDDLLDLLTKVRNFCSANSILFITPHQLSTEAKRLLQAVPQEQFLNHIKGGGFFERSKGLDRIYDIGILLHKIETGSGDYLHVVIDKHRFPSVADSSLKSFYLRFPANKMPIPSNVNLEDYKVLRKIPKSFASSDDSFFMTA